MSPPEPTAPPGSPGEEAIPLVVGASGFLGRRLTEMLCEGDQRVRVAVREGSELRDLPTAEVEVFRCRFDDQESIARAMHGVGIVYNCAGLASDWGPWADFQEANVDLVRNLLRAAAEAASVSRFLHVSTTDVYGYPAAGGEESSQTRDVGLVYNRSKVLGEQVVWDFPGRPGLTTTIVRPATIFGPRSATWVVEPGRLLLKGGVLTVNGGNTGAGLVYVDDVADVMIRLAHHPGAAGQAFNVVDPQSPSWSEYFGTLARALAVPPPRWSVNGRLALGVAWLSEALYKLVRMKNRPLFTRHVVYVMMRSQSYSAAKVLQTVGAFPSVGVEEGIRRTIRWLDTEDWQAWGLHTHPKRRPAQNPSRASAPP